MPHGDVVRLEAAAECVVQPWSRVLGCIEAEVAKDLRGPFRTVSAFPDQWFGRCRTTEDESKRPAHGLDLVVITKTKKDKKVSGTF